jgi:hypothetical protein
MSKETRYRNVMHHRQYPLDVNLRELAPTKFPASDLPHITTPMRESPWVKSENYGPHHYAVFFALLPFIRFRVTQKISVALYATYKI